MLPQLLSFELCQRIRRILSEETAYPYCDPAAAAALQEQRENLGPLLARSGALGMQMDDDVARVWTFAGGRINHTLKYALELLGGWKVVADNFQLRIHGAGISHATVDGVMAQMRSPELWSDPELRGKLLARVPPFRLGKFQPALPDAFATEVVGAHLLDFEGAARLLSRTG